MTYFPPLVTLTIAFAMLFQQPLGAWTGKAAMRFLEKNERKREAAALAAHTGHTTRATGGGMPHPS